MADIPAMASAHPDGEAPPTMHPAPSVTLGKKMRAPGAGLGHAIASDPNETELRQ